LKRIASVLMVMVSLLTVASSAEPETHAMTADDLYQICVASDAGNKAACRFYILGVTQGISVGLEIADGRTNGGRPCVPENISGAALELVVKMKLGADLAVFPADRELDASGVIAGVIVNSFACSKAKH
jgi:Rap1a immunity proteins